MPWLHGLIATATAAGTHMRGDPHALPAAKLILQTAVPLPMLMIVVGAIFLMTLLISRFSLKAGIPAILGVLIFGLAINPSVTLFDHGTIESLHTLSLSMLLFYEVPDQLQMFFQKIGSGLLVGLILGIAIGLLSYGTADLLGGSGFIAAYVTGMFLSNNNYRNHRITPAALQEALLPFNTMTEIAVFLIFGQAMMLVARPMGVMVFQPWSPFSVRESLLLSWCGLRGAVPLALSFVVIDTIPRMRGLDPAMVNDLVRNAQAIVFKAVALNLLVQGMTLPSVCRRLGLTASSEGTRGPLPS